MGKPVGPGESMFARSDAERARRWIEGMAMMTTEREDRSEDDDRVAASDFVLRSDVQRALAAGFSREDVAYMLALPSPEQWEDDRAPHASRV